MGGSDRLGLDYILGPIPGLESPRKTFPSRTRWMYLTLRKIASAKLYSIL
jgi:hypothetical protein